MPDHEHHPEATTAPHPRERVSTPWWYYLSTGATMSAAVIVLFLVPGIVGSLAVLVMIIVNALLQELRRRISGDPPPAFRSRALLYTVSGIVLVLGTLALGWYLVFTLGITSFAWVMGAAVFAVIFVLGWLGDRAGASARAADR